MTKQPLLSRVVAKKRPDAIASRPVPVLASQFRRYML